jgi:uncharacterized protein (TIGR02594 family)
MASTVPPWLATMRQITGTQAMHDNPVILGWARKIGELFPDTADYCALYTHDTTAWCGLTVGYCMATSGIEPVFGANDVSRFLWALAWCNFGTEVSGAPQPGDVLVFDFGNNDHHVTLFEQNIDSNTYSCRGGNQSHQVKLSNYPKSQCIAVRRPPDPSQKVQLAVQTLPQAFTGITATMFGGAGDLNRSAYDGHVIDDNELGVALPARFADPRPSVCVSKDGRSVICKIVDIGPWNTDDPYWQSGTRPQAESGVDRRKRQTNRAGIDLTPAAARAIGLNGKGIVDWEFTSSAQAGPIVPPPTASPDLLQQIITLLEANKMPTSPTSPPPVPGQPDLTALFQQVATLIQVLSGQGAQPAPTPTPAPSPTAAPADQLQQILKVLGAVTDVINGGGGSKLGPVNGALGDTIGNLLNGKKSAIGIIGSVITYLLPIALSFIPGVGPVVGGVAAAAPPVVNAILTASQVLLPIFMGLGAWGGLGKLEKWLPPAKAQT